MKKRVLSIVLCMALVFGCCAAFTPSVVQAKKFSKKQVKIVKTKIKKGFYLPEDDVACDAVYLITNKNKKPASVSFDIYYYSGKGADKKVVYKTHRESIVAQAAFFGIGNDEEMPKYSSYKIKHIKIKKAKAKLISKKKVEIKKLKKEDGNTRISIKNNSKSKGAFEIVLAFCNKKGKVVYLTSTTPWELKPGKKTKIYFDYKAKGVKYKKIKAAYNYFKVKDW